MFLARAFKSIFLKNNFFREDPFGEKEIFLKKNIFVIFSPNSEQKITVINIQAVL